jgi:hypothetical protein
MPIGRRIERSRIDSFDALHRASSGNPRLYAAERRDGNRDVDLGVGDFPAHYRRFPS